MGGLKEAGVFLWAWITRIKDSRPEWHCSLIHNELRRIASAASFRHGRFPCWRGRTIPFILLPEWAVKPSPFPRGGGWRCPHLRVGRCSGAPGKLLWDHQVGTSRRLGECTEIPGHFPGRHVPQETRFAPRPIGASAVWTWTSALLCKAARGVH